MRGWEVGAEAEHAGAERGGAGAVDDDGTGGGGVGDGGGGVGVVDFGEDLFSAVGEVGVV